jgi:hypothetical protein
LSAPEAHLSSFGEKLVGELLEAIKIATQERRA